MQSKQRITVTEAHALARVLDLGGWTDTWFSEKGKILSLSVLSRYFGGSGLYRAITVSASVSKAKENRFYVEAADPSFDISIPVADLQDKKTVCRNLILASAHKVFEYLDPKTSIRISINSPYPPGASVSTSAAISVAIINALSRGLNPDEIAKRAWLAETEVMGGQSGTQDQAQAAHNASGGFNHIEIDGYPNTLWSPFRIDRETQNALKEGLITVCYGSHDSSETHRKVIRQLEAEGSNAPQLVRLRKLAPQAMRFLQAKNLIGFGEVMQESTSIQDDLCEGIVSRRAKAIIEIAKKHKVLGWKVNGAGGDGGSITLLFVSRYNAVNFHILCKLVFADSGYQYFEHEF